MKKILLISPFFHPEKISTGFFNTKIVEGLENDKNNIVDISNIILTTSVSLKASSPAMLKASPGGTLPFSDSKAFTLIHRAVF